LKARAKYERWREELEMVKHEMFWTTLWFKHHEEEWERRWNEAKNSGHKAYTAKEKGCGRSSGKRQRKVLGH
jgi:hypothetical protein